MGLGIRATEAAEQLDRLTKEKYGQVRELQPHELAVLQTANHFGASADEEAVVVLFDEASQQSSHPEAQLDWARAAHRLIERAGVRGLSAELVALHLDRVSPRESVIECYWWWCSAGCVLFYWCCDGY